MTQATQQPDQAPVPDGAAASLDARGVTAGYGKHQVLDGVDVAIRPGGVTALIGPNGSGKSTLLRVLSRLLRPTRGEVLLDGEAIDRLSPRRLARSLAFMPQSPTAPPGVTVRELVGYGRSPHTSWMRRASAEDAALIDRLIARCGLEQLAGRLVHTLSGGERQRAWIAMALAQQPRVLLLDEPVSALDVGHQLEVLDLLTQVNREQGVALVIVLHDLNLAARYCGELVALRDGRVVDAGRTTHTLTPGLLRDCFCVQAQIHKSPGSGYTVCTFERMDPGRGV